MLWLLKLIMVFTPSLSYIPQYRTIEETKSIHGFSPLVCAVIILSGILRVEFWWGKRFGIDLLFQAIVLIGTMFILMKLIVSIKQKKGGILFKGKRFRDFRIQDFWDWDDYDSYLEFILAFSIATGLPVLLFSENEFLIEFVGLLALGLEAALPVPQLIHIYRTRSTKGLSIALVLIWFGGDFFKTYFFHISEAPLQFVLCGGFQTLVDALILVFVYLSPAAEP
eukprot:GCRY01003707.1.p1 GENE.GCRY01003707.1~~GCRY01003707.1.p1  ORF type:complete len:224 (+),score=28.60 GCRY01003707.1:155-826(+)